MKSRIIETVVFAVATLAVASAAVAGRKPAALSWGKPNVSLDAYRQDTLQCANKAYGLDVGFKPATLEALGANNWAQLATVESDTAAVLDHGGAAGGGTTGSIRGEQQTYQSALTSVEPDHVFLRTTTYEDMYRNAARYDVIDQLQAVVDFCLTQRGYHRFRLTHDQRHRLDGLKRGSDARVRYLHSLGADPLVLAAQQQ